MSVDQLERTTEELNNIIDWEFSIAQMEPTVLWQASRDGYRDQRASTVQELVRRIWAEEDRVERRMCVR